MDFEEILSVLEATANMLRGMTLDPAIPTHAKEAMKVRIAILDRVTDAAFPPKLEVLHRVIRELHAYNPKADPYGGEHIHKVWARELLALVTTGSD